MPSLSLDGALSHEVCVFNLPTLPKVWYFMVQCLFMHCSAPGWPLRKQCTQRLCKGLPTTKKHTVMYSVWYCVMYVLFSCQINNFQVQVQVQVKFRLTILIEMSCVDLYQDIEHINACQSSLLGMWVCSSGLDIFCFHTFSRTPVRVSKMNAVARAQLTFQMLTLLKKCHCYIFIMFYIIDNF